MVMSVEKRVDEVAELGIDKEDDMIEDAIAQAAQEAPLVDEPAADESGTAEPPSGDDGNASAGADPTAAGGAESPSPASVAAASSQKPNQYILDYPGFEGIKMSLERVVKMKFERKGTKAAERMRRVCNQLKAGTRAGTADEPVDIEDERAAGVQAHIDPLLLIAKCPAGTTCVVVMPLQFSINNEKSLLSLSTRELCDPKAAVDAQILIPTVKNDELMFFGSGRTFGRVQVPAVACRKINPDVARGPAGRALWQMSVEDMELLLSLHAADVAERLLPALPSGSNYVPYVDADGNGLFVMAGTEAATPDLARPCRRASASAVPCEICGLEMTPGALARHHIGMHLLFDGTWTQRPTFPCGFCGVRPAEPYVAATSLVAGCPTGLEKAGPESVRHLGSCKLVGEVKYSHKPALSSSSGQPCTNVPIICPLCPKPPRGSPGVAVFKYSMELHWQKAHPHDTITAAMKKLVEITAEERAFLHKEWQKANAKLRRSS